MFDDVPEPVWNASIGNWSRCRPRDLVGRGRDRAAIRVDVRNVAQTRVHARRFALTSRARG
jgi:hypothetical protein